MIDSNGISSEIPSGISTFTRLIDVIWWGITYSRTKVLWNGEALEEFKPGRGIGQGDPLLPYLFVLCIERLFHLIN